MHNVPLVRRQSTGGFTLIELLITFVVLAILLGLAVPAFRSMVQNDQQWAQTNNLMVSLNAARSDAIKNDTNFSAAPAPGPFPGGAQICSSNNGTSCTNTAWNLGWIVIGADPANPGNPKVLQVAGALPAGTTLTEVSGGNLSIPFLSNGALNAAALVGVPPVAFRMCDARGPTFARYLQVTLMGRVLASPTPGQDLSSPPNALICP